MAQKKKKKVLYFLIPIFIIIAGLMIFFFLTQSLLGGRSDVIPSGSQLNLIKTLPMSDMFIESHSYVGSIYEDIGYINVGENIEEINLSIGLIAECEQNCLISGGELEVFVLNPASNDYERIYHYEENVELGQNVYMTYKGKRPGDLMWTAPDGSKHYADRKGYGWFGGQTTGVREEVTRYGHFYGDFPMITFLGVMPKPITLGENYIKDNKINVKVILNKNLRDRPGEDLSRFDYSIFLTETKIKPAPMECPIALPGSTQWSECIDDLETRTVYYCDETTNYEVESKTESRVCGEEEVPEPPKPSAPSIANIINNIWAWISNIFKNIGLFISQSAITGEAVVEPNTEHTYIIDLETTVPDHDYSDGTYQVQYANWALVENDGTILNQGNWQEIDGIYYKEVTITTPSNIGDYLLIGVISQYDMVYDVNTKTWDEGQEEIVLKEAMDIQTEVTITEPTKPAPTGFGELFSKIWAWFIGLFGF